MIRRESRLRFRRWRTTRWAGRLKATGIANLRTRSCGRRSKRTQKGRARMSTSSSKSGFCLPRPCWRCLVKIGRRKPSKTKTFWRGFYFCKRSWTPRWAKSRAWTRSLRFCGTHSHTNSPTNSRTRRSPTRFTASTFSWPSWKKTSGRPIGRTKATRSSRRKLKISQTCSSASTLNYNSNWSSLKSTRTCNAWGGWRSRWRRSSASKGR